MNSRIQRMQGKSQGGIFLDMVDAFDKDVLMPIRSLIPNFEFKPVIWLWGSYLVKNRHETWIKWAIDVLIKALQRNIQYPIKQKRTQREIIARVTQIEALVSMGIDSIEEMKKRRERIDLACVNFKKL